MLSGILIAAAIIGGVGLFIGAFLGFAGKAFAVPVDEKEAAVRNLLPGANCGGCGFSGCDALASAIAKGEAPANACVVGGSSVASEVAAVMGTKAEKGVRKVAFVRCTGDCEKTSDLYEYTGTKGCMEASFAPSGGSKSCRYGCMGFGDCAAVCEFGALSIQKGIAVVDETKCKDCKKCIEACPKHLIIEVPAERVSRIGCANPGKGRAVIDTCKIGCISCQKCMKNCPAGAIDMMPGYPVIDYDKCTDCGLCSANCPRKCIV
ncbi:MAG TPA: RnfABCDGE type electron transport complex subunit B [Lachnospiraceae bacterium]|nr:RnfABCDGE type electron transport complex subunit B [Lachnospiraceae bacterium]